MLNIIVLAILTLTTAQNLQNLPPVWHITDCGLGKVCNTSYGYKKECFQYSGKHCGKPCNVSGCTEDVSTDNPWCETITCSTTPAPTPQRTTWTWEDTVLTVAAVVATVIAVIYAARRGWLGCCVNMTAEFVGTAWNWLKVITRRSARYDPIFADLHGYTSRERREWRQAWKDYQNRLREVRKSSIFEKFD